MVIAIFIASVSILNCSYRDISQFWVLPFLLVAIMTGATTSTGARLTGIRRTPWHGLMGSGFPGVFTFLVRQINKNVKLIFWSKHLWHQIENVNRIHMLLEFFSSAFRSRDTSFNEENFHCYRIFFCIQDTGIIDAVEAWGILLQCHISFYLKQIALTQGSYSFWKFKFHDFS